MSYKMKTIFDEIFSKFEYDVLNNLQRWNGYRLIQKESVSEHSFVVTWFSSLIGEETFKEDVFSKYELLRKSIFHDFREVFSFDVNHNVKYNPINGPIIKEAIDEYEKKMSNVYFNSEFSASLKLIHESSGKSQYEYIDKLVKVSDWLSMYWFVKREIDMGNNVEKLRIIHNYCIDSIIECIGLSIDSLNTEAKMAGASFDTKFLADLQQDFTNIEKK